jgi:hypothetical protein
MLLLGLLFVFLFLYVSVFLRSIFGNFWSNIRAQESDELDLSVFNTNSAEYEASRNVSSVAGRLAYAIPNGGKTQRLKLLSRLLDSLRRQGVDGTDIFVFEDDTSRPKSAAMEANLVRLCKKFQAHLVQSHVNRNRKEKRNEFGLFLARHYHFMFDFLLYDGVSSPKTTNNVENKFVFGHNDPRRAIREAPTGRINSFPQYEYVVVLEDDLELADDAVAFFNGMTWPMSRDPTIFCACAHQDNAYYATSAGERYKKRGSASVLRYENVLSGAFHFRRGEHFMAPGFMTSRKIYNTVIRKTWLDLAGELMPWARKRLYNGNWDTYLDFRVQDLECVYATVPRIAHRGTVGYTVRKDRQDAVFGSLRLSNLPSTMDYKSEALNLVLTKYTDNIFKFIKSATIVYCLDSILDRLRNTNVVMHFDAKSSDDAAWARLFTGHMGLIAVGGHTPRMRGVHRGAVFVHYMSNLVLVVATYSMYSPAVLRTAQQNPDYHPSVFKGCFMDEAKKRDLPVLRDLQMVYSKDHRNFATQLCSCECSGFKYAALQNGGECFCGNSFGSYGSGGDSCHLSCDATRSRSDGKMSWCGGALSNAVYELQSSPNSSAVLQQREKIVVGEVGDSCTESCRKANGASEHFECLDSLLPILLRINKNGKSVLHTELSCNKVLKGDKTHLRNVAPGMMVGGTDACYTTIGRHLMCTSKRSGFQRVCACGRRS